MKSKKQQMKIKTTFKKIALTFSGAMVGLINGFLGGGGGTLVVPSLETFSDLPEKKAHATAIAVILPLSFISGILYCVRGNFEIKTGVMVSVGVVIGGIIGAKLLKVINGKLLSAIFYGVMIYAGIKMVL